MEPIREKYELQQLQEIETWENQNPSMLSRAVGVLASPLVWATQKVVPESLMEKALDTAFGAAGAFSGAEDLLADAEKLGFPVKTVADLRTVPLHVSDSLAANVAKWAKGLAAVEGAATGIAGFAGLAADIPAVLVLAIRTIRKVGFCYGFDTTRDAEKTFVLQTLSAGAANVREEKKQAVTAAMNIHQALDQTDKAVTVRDSLNIFSREGFAAAVRNLAKQLCINLTKRKGAQTIPLFGGGVAALMNLSFISDVAEAALRLYQKRRLDIAAVDATTIPVSAEKKP